MSSSDIDYSKRLLQAVLSPDGSKQAGTLAAPFSDNNVSVFSQTGQGSVVLNSSTTSAVVVYDPEFSIRVGQNRVFVFERDASDAVIATSTIAIGRKSDDFTSAGVISSFLSVKNTSGRDSVSGIQSQGVVFTQPALRSSLTSSELADLILEKSKDYIGNVMSRDSGTATLAINDHYGAKMGLTQRNTMGNLSTRFFYANDSTSTALTTTGILGGGSVGTSLTDIIDSRYFSEVDYANPIKEDVQRVDAQLNIRAQHGDTSTGTDNNVFTFRMNLFDAAGNAVGQQTLNGTDVIIQTAADNFVNILANFSAEVGKIGTAFGDVVPRYVTIQASSEHALSIVTAQVVLKAFSPLSDIANRPVHYAVLEGINANGTLSVQASACLAAVPDATNAFISNISRDPNDDVNYADTEELLRQVTKGMQHAFEGDGKKQADALLQAVMASDAFKSELQAFSFRKIGRTIKKVYKGAKKARDVASTIAREAQPVMQEGGLLLQMTGVPGLSQAGTGMLAVSDAVGMAQEEGILKK